MAIVLIKETWHGRAGSDEEEENRKDYIRSFRAQSDTGKDGAKAVLSHPDLPKKGDFYRTFDEEDRDSLCVRRRVVNDPQNPRVLEAILDYSTHQSDKDTPGENPLLEPAVITGDSDIVQKALEWAYARELFEVFSVGGNFPRDPIPGTLLGGDGQRIPVVNTAYDAFDPPPTEDHEIDVLTITKNLQLTVTELQGLRRQYRRKTNSDYILDYPPHHVRPAALTWGNEKRSNVKFKRVTLKLLFSEDGFFYEPMNAGYRGLNLGTGNYEEITDGNGAQLSRPHPLDLMGRKLVASGTTPLIYCRFQTRAQVALSPLLEIMGFEQ